MNDRCMLFISDKMNISEKTFLQLLERYSTKDIKVVFFNECDKRLVESCANKKVELIAIQIDEDLCKLIKENFLVEFSLSVAVGEAYGCSELVYAYSEELLQGITDQVSKYIDALKELVRIGTMEEMNISFPFVKACGEQNFSQLKGQTYNPDSYFVLYSGGIDCTVATYLLNHMKKNVYLMNFNYMQSNRKEEADCIAYLKDAYLSKNHIELIEFNLEHFYSQIAFSSGLLQDELKLTIQNESLEYVPFRNTIFFAITCYYCEKYNIGKLASGSQADDAISPDNSSQYYKAFQKVLDLQYATRGIVFEPILINIGGKPEIINIGNRLGVDFMNCWTCHAGAKWIDGKRYQCGECSDCSTRYSAFKRCNIEDPIPYSKIPPTRKIWNGWSRKSIQFVREVLQYNVLGEEGEIEP